jgi:dipeptidase
MKRLVILLIIMSGFLLAHEEQFDCFSIIVGNKASTDGSVIIAHNEDDKGDNLFVNVVKIPSASHTEDQSIKLKHNDLIPQVKETFGFLWLELPSMEFGDAYMNENGVIIASNSCPSREDQPEITNNGIGFMLRRIIAQRARSSRDAVRIAGQLIDKYGYYSAGRSYCIAGPKEGWILHVVKGKHWIAKRIPDDHVAVLANYYTLGKVDLKDKKNYLGSPDIISYAIKRGWYKPEQDGGFDFAKAYSARGPLKSEGNILRQWRATNLLSRKQYNEKDRFPFSFKPRKKIKITSLFKVLRDHYEDTEYDLTNHYKSGTPNSTNNRTICDETTQYSFVAVLRASFPKEISNLAWIAFRRPDSNAYSPWYLSIDSPPSGYTFGNPKQAMDVHFSRPKSEFKYNPLFAFWTYNKLSELVDSEYKSRIRIVKKKWKNFENYLMENIRKKEKEFLYLLEENNTIAKNIIENYIHNLEFRKWFMAIELIKEISKSK